MKKHDYKDPLGGHIRLYWALIDSPAWQGLTATDQRVYLALRRVLGRTNNGDLSLPLSRARHYGISSPSTLAKSLRALVAVGLVAVTRRGGCTRGGQRLPTLYRCTDVAVYEMKQKLIDPMKVTDEWKEVTSIAHAAALIKAAERKAAEVAQEKRLLQSSNRTGSSIELVEPSTGTGSEAWRLPPLRVLN